MVILSQKIKTKKIKNIFIYIVMFFYSVIGVSFASSTFLEDKPDFGGVIRLGILSEPTNLIPCLSTDSSSHDVSELIYTALIEYDKNLNIQPLAAESYEILDDGRLIRFKLRDDVYWQDGKQLTADDVEFTYKLMIDPKTPTAYAEDFLTIKKFEKTGPLSFDVHYEKPFARSLMTWMGAILPKHALEGEDIIKTSFARNPIGAGPYKLKSWESGSRIILEASDTYFKGRPYLDKAIFNVIPDTSTMFLELKAGNLDIMSVTAQQYLKQAVGPQWEKNWRKYRYLSFSYTYFGFNLSNPLFNDVRTRQAISHAIDRNAIVNAVLLGQGIPAFGPYKPGTWVYNDKIQPVPYDQQKAIQLLKEVGWKKNSHGFLEKDGKQFKFTLLLNQGSEQRIRVANVIQNQLKAIGIEVQIRTVEWAAFLKEFVDKGKFDAVILAWTITHDPDIYDVWHSSKAREGSLNFIGYKNSEVDELLTKARTETDQMKRKIFYDRFQEILHEEQPYCFLYVPYALPIIQAKFRGIEPAPAGIMYNFEQWWIPKALQ